MRHVAVVLLVLPDGRIVLQRRDDKAPTSPKLLSIFGGGVEEGEGFYSAAVRELGEETSLSTQDLRIYELGYVEIPPPDGTPGMRGFHVYAAHIENDQFEVYEGDGAEVHSIHEVLERDDIAPSARVILEKLRSNEWHLVLQI